MAGELADPWAEKQLERLLEIDRAARAVVAYWCHADPTGEFALPHEKALIRAVALEGVVVEAAVPEGVPQDWEAVGSVLLPEFPSDKKGRR